MSLQPVVKRPERAAVHVPQSSAEVTNKWNCTSILLSDFKVWKGTVLLYFCASVITTVRHALLLDSVQLYLRWRRVDKVDR